MNLVCNTIKTTRERLHHNIQANCKINPARDLSGNCNISIEAQKEVSARTKCRMLAKGHVAIKAATLHT